MATALRKKRGKRGGTTALPAIVSALCRQHEIESVRAALVQFWMRSNRIPARRLNKCQTATEFIDTAEPAETGMVLRQLADSVTSVTCKELESAFEALLDRSRRKSHGAVYTPNYIIDYLVQSALAECGPASTIPTVCDPACGGGGFLLRAAEYLVDCTGLSYADAFRRCLIGFDSDPLALCHARCLIELFLATKEQSLAVDQMRLYHTDTLLEPPQQLWTQAGVERGFDVVTTNPPFVKLQNLPASYRQQLIERYADYVKGSFSLALLFLLAGHRLLAPGGCLAYITQNNFFTSLAGQPIREYLHESRPVKRIVDFGHAHVFRNASAYTCLIFLGTRPQREFQFARITKSATGESLASADFSSISWNRIHPRKWRLANRRHLDNLRRIEETGAPLKNVAQIRVGFATLRDSVYLVRVLEGQCFATGQDRRDVVIETDITQPAVKISDLSDESQLAKNTMRIIFPYRKSDGRFLLLVDEELRERFPLAYQHLENCRPLLDARDKGNRHAEGWYAWGRTQGREAAGPKLLTKTFDTRPNFMLDPSDQLFCNGYGVSLRGDTDLARDFKIELLQRILNSIVMRYYAKLTCFQIEGGYQCYQKNFIENFGVPSFATQPPDELLEMSTSDADQRLAAIYGVPFADLLEVVDG